jgi:hypothetical protein
MSMWFVDIIIIIIIIILVYPMWRLPSQVSVFPMTDPIYMMTITASQITNIRLLNYNKILLKGIMNIKYLSDATHAAV